MSLISRLCEEYDTISNKALRNPSNTQELMELTVILTSLSLNLSLFSFCQQTKDLSVYHFLFVIGICDEGGG